MKWPDSGIAILADDLTGASDSGVQLVRMGIPNQVVMEWNGDTNPNPSGGSIVIDTDSRADSAETAYAKVKEAAYWLKRQGYTWIYKKLDSTLRGNLFAEVKAVLDTFRFEAAVIAPAYPRMGRTTVNGIHYLHGIPVHQSEPARDPKTPVRQSELTAHFPSADRRPCYVVSVEVLRNGDYLAFLEATLVQARAAGQTPIFLCDAEHEADMREIATAITEYGSRLLWCGSAGLVECWPIEQSPAAPLSLKMAKPVLVVAGSRSALTHKQIEWASERSDAEWIELDSEAVSTEGEHCKAEQDRCHKRARAALGQGRDVLLSASASLKGTSPYAISQAFGRITAMLVKEDRAGGLVLTGGDTAKAVCLQLNTTGIQLLDEVESGIPVGRLVGDHPLPVITKAGAFGHEGALLRAIRYLKGEHEDE